MPVLSLKFLSVLTPQLFICGWSSNFFAQLGSFQSASLLPITPPHSYPDSCSCPQKPCTAAILNSNYRSDSHHMHFQRLFPLPGMAFLFTSCSLWRVSSRAFPPKKPLAPFPKMNTHLCHSMLLLWYNLLVCLSLSSILYTIKSYWNRICQFWLWNSNESNLLVQEKELGQGSQATLICYLSFTTW